MNSHNFAYQNNLKTKHIEQKSTDKLFQAFILKDFKYLIQPYRGVSWGARKYSSH